MRAGGQWGFYFTDGNMAAIQSGAVAGNTVTAGSGGAGAPAGDDLFNAEATAEAPVAKLIDSQGFVRTKFFDVTRASAVNGGTDEASFTDSVGNDHFIGGPGLSTMTSDACVQSAVSFEVVHAYALSGGTDVAELSDSSGNDTLVATDQYMKLYGDGFFVRAKWFDAAHAYARNGGNDSARLYGTTGNETFTGTNTWAKMVGPATMQRVKFFDNVTAYGKGGTDKAYLYDSPGDDLLTSSTTTAWANASAPPTTGKVMEVASKWTVSSVPGVGCNVKSLSLEKIIRPICWPLGMIWSSG